MIAPRQSTWVRFLLAPGRHPGLVLVVSAVIAALSIWAASRSHSSASIQDLLGKDDPAAAALGHLMDDFSSAEELLVLVSVDEDAGPRSGPIRESDLDPSGDVERLLDVAARLCAALKQSPSTAPLCGQISYSASPQFMEFFTREAVPAGLLYLDETNYRAFMARLTPESMRLQLQQDESMMSAPGPAGNALMKDPLRLRDFLGSRLNELGESFRTFGDRPEFLSSDGMSVLIRVAGVRPPSDLEFSKLITARVGEVARALPAPGFRVDLAGAYAIAAASERAIRADLISSIIWSLVIMQVVFVLGYRSLLSFPVAFIPVALGLAVTFGVHALVTSGLTPLTGAIGAMLVGCGIDYPIYFISYFESARVRGLEPREAGEDALTSLAVPLTAACATSVAGFASIAVSGVKALHDFALLGGTGLLFVLAATIWVLPAALTFAARRGWWGGAGPRIGIGRAIRSVCARPRFFMACCAAMGLAAAASLAVTRGIRFENDVRVMHPSPNRALDTQETIDAKFGGAASMVVYFEALTDQELVSRAYAVQQSVRTPDGVSAGIRGSFGLPSLLPDPGAIPQRVAEMAKLDPDRIIADFDAAVDQSIFEPSAFAPFKAFFRTLLTNTRAPTLGTLAEYPELYRMLVGSSRAGRYSAVTLLSMSAEAAHANSRDARVLSARAALRAVPGAVLTGLGVVGYDVARSVREDLPIVTALAAGAVVVLLLISLRSIRDSALALIPVAFGILSLLGYMSFTGERINLANAVALPLLLGVGTDYGIFVVSMAQQARRAGDGPEGVLDRLEASFHAMLLSAATNVVGFGTLAFTSVPAVQSLGRVIAIGVVACVAGTLLILAPILARLARRKPVAPGS